MFLRMVTHLIRGEESDHFAEVYATTVIPALRGTRGCVYASLMQNVDDTSQGISLTIWNSQAESRLYEESGLYHQLVNALRPYFKESEEYTLQLSDDLSLEYTPIAVEPTIERFDRSIADGEHLSILRTGPYAVQTVTLSVQQDQTENFERLFATEIHPRYRTQKGFMDIILLRQEREYHLISFWDGTVDMQSADGIRTNGELLTSIYRMLPSSIRWKVSHKGSSHTVSSEDMSAQIYRCLTSEWFARS